MLAFITCGHNHHFSHLGPIFNIPNENFCFLFYNIFSLGFTFCFYVPKVSPFAGAGQQLLKDR